MTGQIYTGHTTTEKLAIERKESLTEFPTDECVWGGDRDPEGIGETGEPLSPPLVVIINQHWLRLKFPLLSDSPRAHDEGLARWDDSNTDEHTVRAGLEMVRGYSVRERQKFASWWIIRK